MDIMLVGGVSLMMRALSSKLHKEGHRLYVLSGSRDPGNHYQHVFEQYDFPYDCPSVEEVFRSVQPDVTILLGAFDGNFTGQDQKRETVRFSASLQNILLSWAAIGKGRLIYLSSAEVYGDSYQMPVSVGVIQGGGDTRFSMYMNMVSTWGIVMPLSFLAAFVWKLPVELVVVAVQSDQLFKGIPVFLRFRSYTWIHKLT